MHREVAKSLVQVFSGEAFRSCHLSRFASLRVALVAAKTLTVNSAKNLRIPFRRTNTGILRSLCSLRMTISVACPVPKLWIRCTTGRLPGSNKTVGMGETVGTIFLHAAISNIAISINSRRDKGAAQGSGFAVRESAFGIPDCEHWLRLNSPFLSS